MYNNRNVRNTRTNENRIREEASSQSIYKTSKWSKPGLGIVFQRGDTPSESRAIIIETLAILISQSRKRIR